MVDGAAVVTGGRDRGPREADEAAGKICRCVVTCWRGGCRPGCYLDAAHSLALCFRCLSDCVLEREEGGEREDGRSG